MSKASVDLPEPDTPVTTVKRWRGISTSIDLRLCSRALWMRILGTDLISLSFDFKEMRSVPFS